MKITLSLKEMEEKDRSRVGGKAMALARMFHRGMNVPRLFAQAQKRPLITEGPNQLLS